MLSLSMVHPIGRLLGWWSIDEGSREEQAKIYCAGALGSVFSLYYYFLCLYILYIHFMQIVGNLPSAPALNLRACSLHVLEPRW